MNCAQNAKERLSLDNTSDKKVLGDGLLERQ